MLIIVTRDFEDFLCKVPRKAGALLEVTDKRGKEIIEAGFARKAEIIDGMPKAGADNGNKRKNTTKKA